MPNGHGPKEYGQHKYSRPGTSDCEYGCGCWTGDIRSGSPSGGPLGLDPFGACPGNPVDGKLLGGKTDYENVVTERINNLSARAFEAEEALKKVEPEKLVLSEQLQKAKVAIAHLEARLREIHDLSNTSLA